MKLTSILTCSAALGFLFTVGGCNDDDDDHSVAVTTFVSGFAHDGTGARDFPVLWTGNTYQALPRIDTDCHGYATSVVIFDDTTYVSGTSPRCHGRDEEGNPKLVVGVAVLWKDGQLIELKNPNNNVLQSLGNSIAFNNDGDVVVVGAVSDNTTDQSRIDIPTPAYWKNEKLSMLPLTPSCPNIYDSNCYIGAVATGAVFSGNDLYIAGYAGYNSETEQYVVPVIWKNGVFSALPIQEDFRADGDYKVQVSGNDVYVFGILTSEDTDALPVYWKNGQLHWISQETNIVSDGAIHNDTPYSVGYFYNAEGFPNPGFWRDTELTPLSMYDPKLVGEADAIEYFSGNQYITGRNFYQPDPNDNHIYSKPAIWINGTRIDLDAPPLTGCCEIDSALSYPQPGTWPLFNQYLNSRKPSVPRIPATDNAISHAVTTDIAVGWIASREGSCDKSPFPSHIWCPPPK
jgi:hypothetical protein